MTGDQGLKNQVFNFFRGKGKTFVNISLNGKPLERKEFVYLFDTTNFPEEITPGNLHKFLFGEKLIDDRPRWEIIFEYAVSQGKNGRVVFMDEFFNGLSPEEIKQIKGAIELNGLKSLYISNNYDQALNVADEVIMAHPEDKTIGINSSM
ncbi:MAG: hypothetical protein GY950_04070 [bacterium]|nr:hypothetical protein [bacterium]